jgi:hypothetical protein
MLDIVLVHLDDAQRATAEWDRVAGPPTGRDGRMHRRIGRRAVCPLKLESASSRCSFPGPDGALEDSEVEAAEFAGRRLGREEILPVEGSWNLASALRCDVIFGTAGATVCRGCNLRRLPSARHGR